MTKSETILSALSGFPYGATCAQIEAIAYTGEETEEILNQLERAGEVLFDGKLWFSKENAQRAAKVFG